MQQYHYNCQLHPEEKRLLAEAEPQSQEARLRVLYTEMEEAIRRMQRAKLALVEVSHALV